MATDILALVKTSLIGELEHLRDEIRKLAEPLTETKDLRSHSRTISYSKRILPRRRNAKPWASARGIS